MREGKNVSSKWSCQKMRQDIRFNPKNKGIKVLQSNAYEAFFSLGLKRNMREAQ